MKSIVLISGCLEIRGITPETVYTHCRVKAIGFHSQYTLKKVSFYRKVGQRVLHPFYPLAAPRLAGLQDGLKLEAPPITLNEVTWAGDGAA